MVPAVVAGVLVTVVVSLRTAPPPEAAAEFDDVWADLDPDRHDIPAHTTET